LAFVLGVLGLGIAPAPATAVDGVIEINQARALAGGVTATDTAGFPVTIDASGSFRLTSDLTVPMNTTGISITGATAKRVSIDLNGFSIKGPVTCTNPPTVTCSGGTLGRGIDVNGTTGVTLDVAHGVIEGMGAWGISAGDATLRDLRIRHNGADGVIIGSGLVENVVATNNHLYGISTSDASIVRGSAAARNGGIGIEVNGSSLVINSTAYLNVGTGIFGGGGVVSGCASVANQGYGIDAAGGTVVDSNIRNNTGYGLKGTSAGYARNVLSGNNGAGAEVDPGAVQMGTNLCNGASCP